MGSLIGIAVLGFVLGLKHAMDPDHVIAVSTIVTRHRSILGAAVIGAVWGIGHTLTILLIGTGIIAFGWVIPERLGLSMELGVGLMLILLGVLTLHRWWSERMRGYRDVGHTAGRLHSHAHAHGDYVHTHVHGHNPDEHPHGEDENPVAWLDRHFEGTTIYSLIRPLLIGVIQGLAGSAALSLLVLPAIGDIGWSIAYLFIFGLGTVTGMLIITTLMASPLKYAGLHSSRLQSGLNFAAGAFSLTFGMYFSYHIGSLLV